ncbi:MAG TPA: DNA polymerase III subunit delta, partial [Bacillota bacterium]|nr:DNA polymerase III subunit delta [Bacillota bacterium]
MSSIGNYRALWQHLKRREFERFYLLHGSEEGLIAQAEALLRDAVLAEQAEDLRSFNVQSISGSDLDPAQLSEALQAMPMFADRRVVSVNDIPMQPSRRSKKRGEDSEAGSGEEGLLAAIESCPESTVVIITAANAPKTNGLVKHVAEHGLVYEFPALRREDAQELIDSEARRHGVELDRSAMHELMNLTGVDGRVPVFRLIKSELAKLAAYAGYSGRISAADVSLMVTRSAESKLWDLTDAVSARNYGRALGQVQALWEDGYEPIRVLAGLTSHVSGLLLARRALDDGIENEEIIRSLGREPYRLHSFPAGKLISAARQVPAQALSRSLDACLELDLALKTGKREPVLGVEIFLS